MQANQQVTFLTDGADDVRDLTVLINENAEHVLDWFHVTMRLTVIGQLAKGLDNNERDVALELLQRVKRFLWHGNLYRARQLLAWLHVDLAAGDSARHARLIQLVDDFDGYLDANAASIPHYGARVLDNELGDDCKRWYPPARLPQREALSDSPTPALEGLMRHHRVCGPACC